MTEDTQEAIADDLGVDDNTVHRAIHKSEELVKLSQQGQVTTDEKREQVREFVEDSIHIVGSNTLNIPSEREQKRGAVRSYIENNPTPGPGADGFPGSTHFY